MIAVLETFDPVRLSYLKEVLEAAGLHPFVFQGLAPYPGVQPYRLMAPESEVELARRLVREAEA